MGKQNWGKEIHPFQPNTREPNMNATQIQLVQEVGQFRVGDLVRRDGSPVVYRIERLEVFPACPEGFASFLPVKKDGTRDKRRTPFSGSLRDFVKA